MLARPAGLFAMLACACVDAGAGEDGTATGDGGTATTTAGDGSASTSSASDESTGGVPIVCDDVPLRLATFNIRNVGAVGSPEHAALSSILTRIDADVVCLEEVSIDDDAAIEALAADLELDLVRANYSPPIGGDLSNACLSRIAIDRIESFTASELSSDPGANDLGRDILAVRVSPQAGCEADVLVVHLKSGIEPLDLFRRQVEIVRLLQAVALVADGGVARPSFVVGDFNESLDDPAIGTLIDAVPPGLPGSYDLGADVVLPLVYDPFGALMGAGLTIADATLEDSADASTWNGMIRLDYVFHAGAVPVGAEVYESCRDDGIDDPALPGGVAKAGEPLACGVSDDASDHDPVIVDVLLRWP
jgi:endonuclease/exonuclease/phosphatase family metal-dependent hydrolase